MLKKRDDLEHGGPTTWNAKQKVNSNAVSVYFIHHGYLLSIACLRITLEGIIKEENVDHLLHLHTH